MNVGKLTRVPLRDVWKHEATGFTRWVEDNIELLNEVIDLTLVGVEREKLAGDFSVDLVAEDQDGGAVVIENQLEPSDHNHLGKLLTYVAALEAKAAIWIIACPRPEHVKAVTWLNETTGTPFYLLKVEAVTIGNSEPAVLFTQIVGPSPEARAAGETRQELNERQRVRRSFWTLLLDRARPKTKLHSAVSPGPDNWISTGAGMSGLGWNYSIRQHDTQVELYIDRGNEEANLRIFEELLESREEIDAAFGEPLDWQRLEGRQACRISHRLARGGWKDQYQEKWPEIADATIEAMIRLERAVGAHLPKAREVISG